MDPTSTWIANRKLLALLLLAVPLVAGALFMRMRWERNRPAARTGQAAEIARLSDLARRNPQDVEARQRLAMAHLAAGHPAEAAAAMEESLTLAPDAAPLHLGLARILAAQGRGPAVRQAVQRAVALAPGDARLLCEAGKVLQDFDDPRGAHRLYERAIAAAPHLAAPRLYLGQFFLMLDDTPDAIQSFRKAAELEPENAGAQLAVADAALRMGRLTEAKRAADRALSLRPQDADTLLVLGLIHLQRSSDRKELDEALTLLQRAAEAAPGDVLAHYNLGRAALRAGQAARAAADLERAVELDPHHLAARMNLARAYQRLGRTEDARRHLRIAQPFIESNLTFTQLQARLRRQPQDAEAHYRLGRLLLAQGQREAAARRFRRALRYRPDHSPARQALAGLEPPASDARGGTP